MDLSKIPLFNLINKRMSYLGERQKVLAENLANSDTPQYEPKDLKAFDFRSFLKGATSNIALMSTSGKHLSPNTSGSNFEREKVKKPFETTPSKNKVVIEEQVAKMAETNSDYQMTANLYAKHVAMIKTALGRGA
ncbi:MAG: flagellar basal body rod protein FlgB [Alphaproteobacteria bacterium]|nr:flagellar basal body rod protein FlgB [Alphaproteobacteria bacterium]